LLTLLVILGVLAFLFSDKGKIAAVAGLFILGHGLVWGLLLLSVFGAFK